MSGGGSGSGEVGVERMWGCMGWRGVRWRDGGMFFFRSVVYVKGVKAEVVKGRRC